MFKYSVIIFLIYFIHLFPQDIDSLSVINDSTIVKVKPDSTISINDTSVVIKNDSLAMKESIVPIQTQPLTETSFIISRKDFLFSDYRYAGDFLKQFPLTFTQDLGFVGYPNNSFIYGIGNGGVSYLMDGILWNDRYFNSLDLNLIQSEDVDSIEIIPLPRGFLYGPFNNAVSVNFITRDFVSQAPYSRIKYYEGPDGEAMIDGKFNAFVMKRWNFSFEVTNRGKDSTYTNSEFSLWQANAKLKYFLSNEINISAEYRFNHLRRGLNDGINVDSVRQITTDINSILYDPLQAPVNSPFRKQEILQNSVVLKALAKRLANSRLKLSIYYQYGLNKLKNYQDTIRTTENFEEKIYGISFDYDQRFGAASFKIISSYEIQDLYYESVQYSLNNFTQEYNYFSLAGIISLHLFNDNFLGSIFLKHNNFSGSGFNDNKFGEGIDLKYKLLDLLHFYVGVSRYDNENNKDMKTLEAGGSLGSNNLLLDIKYFNSDYDLFTRENFGQPEPLYVKPSSNVKGFGVKLNYKIWMLSLETSANHFNTEEEVKQLNISDWQFAGGIYLNNFFFNDNLYLKTGFKFYYSGKIETNSYTVDPSNKLDFNLFGEIQERAIIYFVWENLFNEKYYITTYFPMPERNVRFGVAWELFN